MPQITCNFVAMVKKLCFILMLISTPVLAQSVDEKSKIDNKDLEAKDMPELKEVGVFVVPHSAAVEPSRDFLTENIDTLHLPAINGLGQVRTLMHPLWYSGMYGGYYNWDIHKGLNVTLGASVFAEFGKNARSGAGFAQNISMLYATPITNKLSLAMGGYLNNVNWGRFSTRNAGVSGVLGYQFNEHWEAYLYGQKQVVQSGPMLPQYMIDCAELGDRIGASLKYNFSPTFSVQMSVERGSR